MKRKEHELETDFSLRIKRLRAYLLGDLNAAVALFDRDMAQEAAGGKPPTDAIREARKTASLGVGGAGISAAGFLLFCGVEARIIAPRWPTASLVWFALWTSAALLFAWHYYAMTGPMGWRRAWYRLTGDPRIEDFSAERAIEPLGRMLSRWKFIVRLACMAGAVLLLAGMMAIRFAPMAWSNPWYWATITVVVVAVYWPSIYLDAIKPAYHPMCAARWFGDS